ncbi:hypothetical protein D9M73_76360 [compost metagenome]
MPLVTTKIGQACFKLLAPGDGRSVIAGMACKGGITHFRQQLRHHFPVAAKAVASQDDIAAGHPLHRAIRSLVAHAKHLVVCIQPQLADQRFCHQCCAAVTGSAFKLCHQCGAGTLMHGMHAPHAVARVQKTFQYLKPYAVHLLQTVQRRPDGTRICMHQVRSGRTPGFCKNVSGKQGHTVVNAFGLLDGGARCWNEPRGQRSGSAGRCIALQHHAVNARLTQGDGSHQAAGARAHNDHRHLEIRGH